MKKKFYITTSIVYTNAPPHIGFALESIQADVLARYYRFLGKEVFFLTGTDEHGRKVAEAAAENKKLPKEFCDDISRRFKELIKILNISNNDFIRTTDQKRHWPAVKKVWLKLKENGDIYKKKYKGFYCVGCEAFIKEKDLVDGKCPLHARTPEVIEEENYFFRLSKYQNQLKKIIKREEIKIIPETRKSELLSFITQGLEDTSCSRPKEKLKWGIPVPDDKTHLVYVWLEALVNYLSALDYTTDGDKFKKFWPPNVHCIGKDIFVRFHGSLWPAMLLSLGLPLPKTIFVHGFITVDGQKISKSIGNVIDPFELVKKYDTDAVRYFLLREIPPTEDGDFTYEKFEARYNSDLASGLGNLAARVITMAKNSKFQIPNHKQISNPELQTEINKTWKNYRETLDEFKFNETLMAIWDLISFADGYIERERPWEVKTVLPTKEKDQKFLRQRVVIFNLLFILGHIADLLQPFLPETAEKIFKQLGIRPTDKKPWQFKIKKGRPLFPRIET